MSTATIDATPGTRLDVEPEDGPDDHGHHGGGIGAALLTAARFTGNLVVACAAVLGLGGADDY